MLKWSPWRFQMGRIKNFYVQLAPILNKIDAMLEWILSKVEVVKEKEVMEEYFNTFIRAFNFFHHIVIELNIGEQREEVHRRPSDDQLNFMEIDIRIFREFLEIRHFCSR